jgi:hypothetical protein
MAELASAEELVHAVRTFRENGHTQIAAYTPHPVPELDEALGYSPSLIPYVVLFAGLAATAGGFALQYYLDDVDYPINIGGFPVDTMFAYVPITFEAMVLGAVVAAVLALLVATGLPMLWHPVFEVPGFESASIDGYWLAVPTHDDAAVLRTRLEELGAVTVTDARLSVP